MSSATQQQERRLRLATMDLTELGRPFGTDKATTHRYTQHYERHLRDLEDREFSLGNRAAPEPVVWD